MYCTVNCTGNWPQLVITNLFDARQLAIAEAMLKAFCLWIQFISPFPPWFLSVCGTQRKSFILYNIHIHIHIHIHVLHNFSTVQVFSLAFYSREHIRRANWQESAQYYISQKNLNKVSKDGLKIIKRVPWDENGLIWKVTNVFKK